MLAENRREAADLLLPLALVKFGGLDGFADRYLRLFAGEVGRGIFFFGAHLGLGLYLDIDLRGLFVHAVGVEPEDAGNGVGLVVHRNAGLGQPVEMLLSMRVIQIAVTDTHRNIG